MEGRGGRILIRTCTKGGGHEWWLTVESQFQLDSFLFVVEFIEFQVDDFGYVPQVPPRELLRGLGQASAAIYKILGGRGGGGGSFCIPSAAAADSIKRLGPFPGGW